MKGIFRVLSLLLSAVFLAGILAVTPVSAKSEKSGKFKYKVLSDGSARLIEYTGKRSTLRLPEKLGGHKLTELGDYAVNGNTTVVVIPKTVRKISCRAFGDSCYIKRFKVSADNKYFSVDSNGVLYNKDKTTLVRYTGGKNEKVNYTVAESVTEIADCAFNNVKLKGIKLPSKLKKIGFLSFSDCKLKSITFPSTLQSIGELAFSGNLFKSLTFPGSLRYIGKRAFCYFEWDAKKPTLTSVTLNEGLETIAKCAFEDTALESVHIPSTVKKIAYDAFSCPKFKSWTVDENNSFFTVGSDGALYNKSKTLLIGFPKAMKIPENYTVPNGVKKIGMAVFDGRDLDSVKLPSSLEEIGDYAFTNSWIQYLNIPSGVKRIGKAAFLDFAYLGKKELKLPDGLREIDDRAFCGASIDKITLPSSLVKLGEGAFDDTNITSVDIPGSIKKIGACCFQCCEELKKVTLHNGLEKIGVNAFCSCVNLKSIKFPSTLKSIGAGAFEDVPLSSISLPKGLRHIGKEVFVSTTSSGKLKKISLAKGNKYFSVKENVLYNKKKTKLLLYPPRREDKTFTTPKTVREICRRSFAGARLKELNITGNVKTIGKEAFDHAKISKKLTLNYGLRTIKTRAFTYTEVGGVWWKLKLPDSVRNISKEAFYASDLVPVNIPKNLRELKSQVFFGTYLDELTIPPSVKKIGYAAFGFGVGECGSVANPIKTFTVRGKRNSAAHKYAKKYKMKFIAI